MMWWQKSRYNKKNQTLISKIKLKEIIDKTVPPIDISLMSYLIIRMHVFTAVVNWVIVFRVVPRSSGLLGS
jgi:hypothetical protein